MIRMVQERVRPLICSVLSVYTVLLIYPCRNRYALYTFRQEEEGGWLVAGNRLLIFQSEAPVFLPHLLEVGLYHGAALPEEKKDTAWHLGRPKADYLLFHCITGGLRIACRQKEYSLQAGCALLLDGKQAVSVEAQAGARVAAFRFRCEKGKPPLRVGRVNQVAHGPVQEALYTVLSAVDEPAEPLACNQLSLQFALLLYEWRGAAENRERKPTVSAYEAEIHEAVSYMRAHLDEKNPDVGAGQGAAPL